VSDTGQGDPSSSDVQQILNDASERKRQFDEFLASSTTTLNQLIEKARGDAAEVDRLKTEVASLKGGIEATYQAASTDLGVVTQTKADIEAIKSAAASLSESVSNSSQDTSTKLSALEELRSEMEGALSKVTALKAEIEAARDSANEGVANIESTNAKFGELATEATDKQAELAKRQDELRPKIEEIDGAHAKISVFQSELFENTHERDSLEVQIIDLRDRMAKLLDTASKDGEKFKGESEKLRNELFKSLETKILALLPSAGAAGFAYTYYDAKSKYSPTSFAGAPGGTPLTGWKKRLRSLAAYNPASLVATITFYLLFFTPLAVVALGSFQLLQKLEADPHFVLTNQMLALRLLVAIPLATISGFGFASLRLYRQLYEEYNHKQRVMELYESFKTEIDDVGSDEQKKLLLTIMLNAVASKASDHAKDDSKSDETAFSKLERWSNLITKLKSVA